MVVFERQGHRPPRGFGHYLRDLVYGALDGVITTMAIVTVAEGAHLQARVGVVMGVANLIADGISMGASNYLGLKSELQQRAASVRGEAPWRHGLATFAAFLIVGSLPLLGYAIAPAFGWSIVTTTLALSAIGLLITGAARSPFVGKRTWNSAAEMLAVGALAGGAAYGVGAVSRIAFR